MNPTKKISFSFTKATQKSNILTKFNIERKNIELIDCVEEQTIKIKDVIQQPKKPLVIPIRDNSKHLLDRIKVRCSKMEVPDLRSDSELTLNELAAKQLIEEAGIVNTLKQETKVFQLPGVSDKLVIEGKEESSLADYEDVPINDYGLAMLRGMGWTEGAGIGKLQKVTTLIEPELRPKGMGLGARKIVNAERKLPSVDINGKELILIKGAFVKIIAGMHRGNYCEVLGLDEESGRVIVKASIKNIILSLNEFLVEVVTPEEYAKSSKLIYNAKYEEFIGKSNIKSEHCASTEDDYDISSHSRSYTRSNLCDKSKYQKQSQHSLPCRRNSRENTSKEYQICKHDKHCPRKSSKNVCHKSRKVEVSNSRHLERTCDCKKKLKHSRSSASQNDYRYSSVEYEHRKCSDSSSYESDRMKEK